MKRRIIVYSLVCVGCGLWALLWATESAKSETVVQTKITRNVQDPDSVSKSVAIVSPQQNPNTRTTSQTNDCININTSEPDDLSRIPGIGPVIAVRVFEFRKKHGPFLSINDLDQVKGIGPSKLRKLKDYVCF